MNRQQKRPSGVKTGCLQRCLPGSLCATQEGRTWFREHEEAAGTWRAVWVLVPRQENQFLCVKGKTLVKIII